MKLVFNKDYIKYMVKQQEILGDNKNLLMIKLVGDNHFTYLNDAKQINEFINQFNNDCIKFIEIIG